MDKQLEDIKHNAIMGLDYQIDTIQDFFSGGQDVTKGHLFEILKGKSI